MEDEIKFRPLARSDFPLLQQWLVELHVVAWWREPLDHAGIETKYGPRIEGIEPTHVYVIEYAGRSVGWIQWYRWADYPAHAGQLGAERDSAGIDLAIGEVAMLGRGLGPRVIRRFLDDIVLIEPAIGSVVSDPEATNIRSLRAFEKAGFTVTRKVKLAGEETYRRIVRTNRHDLSA